MPSAQLTVVPVHAAAMFAAKDSELTLKDTGLKIAMSKIAALEAETKNTELEEAWLNAEGKISDLEHKLAQINEQKTVGSYQIENGEVMSTTDFGDGKLPFPDGDLLFAAPVAGEAETIERLREALRTSESAISEFYRYWTGGEMRGSYDGKPERDALWKAMYSSRFALSGKEAS